MDHWTSGTVYECSEIAGSPQGCGFQTDIFTLESTWQYTIEYAVQLEAELYTVQTQPRKLCICGTDRQVNLKKQLYTVGHNQDRTEYMWTGGEGSVRSVLAQLGSNNLCTDTSYTGLYSTYYKDALLEK